MHESPSNPIVGKRRYVRFTRWRRRRFFALLAESGSVRLACELSGVGLGCIYRLRRTEPGFVAAMDAARAKASGRLETKEVEQDTPPPPYGRSPSPGNPGEEFDGLVVRRGIGGRLRLMAAGEHWWSARHDALFLEHLRETGNIAASARAAGFTPKSAWNQRAARPGFARGWDQALMEADVRLEQRMLTYLLRSGNALEEPIDDVPPPPFDFWHAIWFLKRRDRKEAREERERARRGWHDQ